MVVAFLRVVVLLVVCCSYKVTCTISGELKRQGLSINEWNLYFRSDASLVFSTNEDFLSEIQRLWAQANDDSRMKYALRTAGPGSSETTLALQSLLSDGGHFEFVGNSKYYLASMTRSEAVRAMDSSYFDLVFPIPVLLKVSTEILREFLRPSSSATPLSGSSATDRNEEEIEETFNQLISLDISISPKSGVDVDTLAERWQSSQDAARRLATVSSPSSSDPPPVEEAQGDQQLPSPSAVSSPFLKFPANKLASLTTWLMTQKEVDFVDRRYTIYPLNNQASWITQTNNEVEKEKLLWEKGLTGKGQTIGFSDTGIDMGHCMFRHAEDSTREENKQGKTGVCKPWDNDTGDHECRKVVQYIKYRNGWEDEPDVESGGAGHGTHIAGSLAGNDIEGGQSFNGMAPDAKLAFMDLYKDGDDGFVTPQTAEEILRPAFNAKARVYSVSWGTHHSTYTDLAKSFDDFLFNEPEMVVVAAVGNDGMAGEESVGSPATAKNVISVGATLKYDRHTPDGVSRLASFSSLGPTADGRLKPDVCAPGKGIRSALQTTVSGDRERGEPGCGEAELSGTSMSTPIVAGNVALARQYFMEGFYPTGKAVKGDEFTPSGALLKAVMVLGTQPLTHRVLPNGEAEKLRDYPDFNQGYGRIQMDQSLPFEEVSPFGLFVDGDVSDQPRVKSDEIKEYPPFVVQKGHPDVPFRVVLTWYDPSTAPDSKGTLVNDLDLQVEVRDQFEQVTTYCPDHTHPKKDRKNNLEVVTIPGTAGLSTYTVKVTGTTILSLEDHPDGFAFALAVSGRIKGTPFTDEVHPNRGRSSSSSSDGGPDVELIAHYGAVVLGCGMLGLLASRGIRRYGGDDSFHHTVNKGWRDVKATASTVASTAATTVKETAATLRKSVRLSIRRTIGDGRPSMNPRFRPSFVEHVQEEEGTV